MPRLSVCYILPSCSRTALRPLQFPNQTLSLVRRIRTNPPTDPSSPSPTASVSKSPQRFEKVFNKTPKFLRKWIQPIANKPLSHITSFLILHEITAVVPLAGLFYLFHKTHWTPPILPGEWLLQGVEKGAKVIRHYGIDVKGEQFVRMAFEFAAAWASVKALLPLRLVLSVWGTPWFARVFMLPFLGLFRRKKVKGVMVKQNDRVKQVGEDVKQ